MKPLHPALLIVLLIFTASISTANESIPFYFGLSNAKGSQVIIYDNNSNAPQQLHAVLPSGEKCLLNYVGKRARKPADNGRQTASNFDNLEGIVFQTSDKCLEGDRTSVLINPVFLDKHKPIPITPRSLSPLNKTDISRVEAVRKLKIKSSWNLASLNSDTLIALIQFFPRENANIASLALITKERIVFEDYKGNAKDINSVWRVDDGGIFNPDDFAILAAFQSPYGYELVRAWAGPEGENSVLLREDGEIFSKVITQYRYWVGL